MRLNRRLDPCPGAVLHFAPATLGDRNGAEDSSRHHVYKVQVSHRSRRRLITDWSRLYHHACTGKLRGRYEGGESVRVAMPIELLRS